MSVVTRVALAVACGVASLLLIVAIGADAWYYVTSDLARYLPAADATHWYGFGGPSCGSTVIYLAGLGGGLATLVAVVGGVLLSLGTIFGRRRDLVPRWPARLAAVSAPLAIPLEAIAVAGWADCTIEYATAPRGYGWAVPLYFVAATSLAVVAPLLWRDGRRRARENAAALARVERDQAAADLAEIPGGNPQEDPVPRV